MELDPVDFESPFGGDERYAFLMITEMGSASSRADGGPRGHDDYRIRYLEFHLERQDAIAEGVPLIGSGPWSFTDVLRWLNGFEGLRICTSPGRRRND